jgi:hypothetical protein
VYLKNLLGVPGGISLAGVPIDLSKVKVPACLISTAEDHIAPWNSTYKGAHYRVGLLIDEPAGILLTLHPTFRMRVEGLAAVSDGAYAVPVAGRGFFAIAHSSKGYRA